MSDEIERPDATDDSGSAKAEDRGQLGGRAGARGVARSASARLVAGAPPDAEVRLDELAAGGSRAIQVASAAAAVDDYLQRNAAEAERFDGEVRALWEKSGEQAGVFAQLAAGLRVHLVALANIDMATREAPGAAARLREDLAEYLAKVEGVNSSPDWS